MAGAIRTLSKVDRPGPGWRRYLCLPPAGGSLGTLGDLASAAPSGEVWGAEYPGRGGRAAEPFPDSLEELAEPLARELTSLFPPGDLARTVVVGFSMGAFVALELARRVVPAALVVVGAVAPQRRVPGAYARTDAAALGRLLRRDGLTPVLGYRRNPEVWEYALDLLRRDLRLVSAYRGPSVTPLPCPVAALCGSEDPACATEDATEAWRAWTSGRFVAGVVPGGHLGILDPGREPGFWTWLRRAESTLIDPEVADV
ncbi:thioesterase II family protein [Amycolatopsis sp. 195334CR]|uniref:thioesterase II family protein n=1 Tax=Amycolatopsis sp. 195334CR TaxID=2814588 RepID=UPI001A8EB2EB|nr:alpha/beta fold hydrolase [Amycolatopsis sp. 195334CR]MBN6038363.1 thioesterase [Amycolatopsis sp. 195334CR]